MGDGASVEVISRLLGKWLKKDHTKLSILAAGDDGGSDDTSKNDDGTRCYYQITKHGSKNLAL